ncbi:hypothetical protein Bca52824_075820 [Brassica carinata]|uniref:Uncharacterized protein n=1 Tax=Brassica carinata TaxID=52824 RepID=A0A8X7PR32_BRACI|nr:hypothetical protein Bca52824_075820 [Brassica carinata]
MVKTKFTRNGKEVMIFGAMRNFDYGSDEAVQESKKGGERDASVSLPSLERSRIRKSVEGISMLASTEVSKASKTRRGTSYGSPASSPEKTTRRGTSYGSPASSPVKATRRGSTLSPRVSKKQKVNVALSGDDREEWLETEMLESTVAKKTRRGTSSGGSPVSPRQSKKQKVNSERSLGDDGDDREEFLQIEEFGDIGDDGREDENGIAGIEEVGCL